VTVITCLTCFFKADFINLTVCAVAIHVLVNAEKGKKDTFRLLTFMTVCSLILDILWLAMRPSEKDPEFSSGDGGVARFSQVMAWIALIFKIIMSFVYWRMSLDF